MESKFLRAFNLHLAKKAITPCVSIFGAGGKTSLLFLLAREGAAAGKKILVSTTTKMWIPTPCQYTVLDLTGHPAPASHKNLPTGITVVGKKLENSEKIRGVGNYDLQKLIPMYDLVLLETDGAAEKPLKGWKSNEPVIPTFTTHSIGVADISQLHKKFSSANVHRLDIFIDLIQANSNSKLNLDHFVRILSTENGLMKHAIGQQFIFLNKAEQESDLENIQKLRQMLPQYQILAGSALHNQLK